MGTMQETIAPPEETSKKIKTFSRRDFLKAGAAASALAVVTACAPTVTQTPTPTPTPTPKPTPTPTPTLTPTPTPKPTPTPTPRLPFRPTTLTDYQVQVLMAATARLIPTDDAPGAREANVARFIDRALRQENSTQLGEYISGLGNLDIVSDNKFKASFIELTPQQQDEVLKAIESTAFFGMLRTHTINGMFSDPLYGGNQDMVGWKLIRFSGAMFHPLQTGHIEPGWMPTDADYTSLLSRYGDINPYGQ